MNDLEMVTSKIVSAREIIDSAIDKIQEHQYDKAETMIVAAYEFLEYYLNEFDEKFKLAWQETVIKQKKEEDDAWDAVNREKEYYEDKIVFKTDGEDRTPRWNSFWDKKDSITGYNYQGSTVSSVQYTDEELNAMCDAAEKQDKVVKWQLPVEVDYTSGEYFVKFPDDLMEAAKLEENDTVEWIDQGDGSYLLKKVK